MASNLAAPIPVEIGPERLQALLGVPDNAQGLVIFAHGSGSGRLSPRNNYVAEALRKTRFATLLLDLLTQQEEQDRANVFDIELLASRLTLATEWAMDEGQMSDLRIGYFGASTGAAAAIVAAAAPDSLIDAVVSRGGRPDMAGDDALSSLKAPTLLLVGSLDGPVINLNQRAYDRIPTEKQLTIVPGAGHLFEEPGTMDEVIAHAILWFRKYLGSG